MDRRNSDDDRTPPGRANPNVFDDEFELDPDEDDFMPAVSDGFRPSGLSGQDPAHDDGRSHGISPPPTAFTNTKSAESDLRRLASRNSTAKTPYARQSVSQAPPNHETNHTRGASSQANTALQHRASVSSTASFATMARSESPLPGGPSHPYGMYPQNTMARSASVTTASTAPQPHRSMSLQRPAHPYGMYTQNVVEDEPPVPAVQSAIPVGFPGLNTGYHRQIGPDGEEQDIVGPDGHTEQLPPYSRYPEEVPTKAALAVDVNSTSSPVEAPRALPGMLPGAVAGTVPGVAAAAAVPLPASASNDALISTPTSPMTPAQSSFMEQHQSNRSSTTAVGSAPPGPAMSIHSSTTSTTTSEGASEKQALAAEPQSWRSKKLWGKVPMGVAVILLVLVLIFAIVLGAAIGTFVTKNSKIDKDNKNHNDNPQPQVSGTDNVFDASAIFPLPTSLPALPAGDFALPLGLAQESSPGCLPQANQLSAWSCKMSFAPLKFHIDNSTSNPDQTPHLSLEGYPNSDGTVLYGLQPPPAGALQNEELELVSDMDYPSYGPAWHFVAQYDKLVVLRPEEFSAGSGLRKRDDGNGSGKPYEHRFQVSAGETPWYCYWNQTYIEAYVYVSQDSTAATMGPYPTTGANSWSMTSMPTSAPTSGVPATSTSSTPVTSASATTTVAAKRFRRRGDSDQVRLAPYPRIVKIEERRLPGAPEPYCQKMQVLDNLQVSPVHDSNGNPVILSLQEQDPSLQDFRAAAAGPPSASSSGSSNSSRKRALAMAKRKDPSAACHCQWLFQ